MTPNDNAGMPSAMASAFGITAAASTTSGQRRSSMTGLQTTNASTSPRPRACEYGPSTRASVSSAAHVASTALASHSRRPPRDGFAAE